MLADLINAAKTYLVTGVETRINGTRITGDTNTVTSLTKDTSFLHDTSFHASVKFSSRGELALCHLVVQTRPSIETDNVDGHEHVCLANDPEGGVWQRFSFHAYVTWPKSDDVETLKERVKLYQTVIGLLESLQPRYEQDKVVLDTGHDR